MTPLLKRALDAAAVWHRDQHRKYPDARVPYVAHVAGVAVLLARHGFDDEVVAAGALHDVVEDCGVTLDEIAARFGARVAALVHDVTEADRTLPWEERKAQYLARFPGKAKAGQACKQMVANLDLPETFLDAAGVAVPGDMQGRSMMPLLRGETPKDWRRSFYYHYYEGGEHNVARHCGVRTDRYTLAHYYDSDEWELFDREKDPREMRSVSRVVSPRLASAASLIPFAPTFSQTLRMTATSISAGRPPILSWSRG